MTIEHFCYLVVCRQEANKLRRRLYFMSRRKKKPSEGFFRKYSCVGKAMRDVAVACYSPAKRALGAKVYYDANNNAKMVRYVNDDQYYLLSMKQVEYLASSYVIDSELLDVSVTNPYSTLVSKYG